MASTNNDIGISSLRPSAERVGKGFIENGSLESPDDLENEKVMSEGDEVVENDQWVKSSILTVLLLLVALLFSCLLSQYIIDGDDGRTASASLVASMALGIIAMATLFQQIWAGQVHLRDNTRQHVQVSAILRDNLSLVGIIFFCPFACLLDIFQVYTEISCGESWKMIGMYQFYAADIVYRVLHIILMTMELLFCMQFRRLLLKENVSKIRRFCVKFSLTIVVAANIGIWFNITLQEALDNTWTIAFPGNDSMYSYGECLIDTFGSVEENVRHALYPFTVEFSLLVVEFVVSHLMFMKKTDDIIPRLSEREKKREPRAFSPRQLCSSTNSCDRVKPIFPITSPLVIVFGVLPNLVYFTFSFFSNDEIFSSDFTKSSVTNNQHFVIFYWFFLILLVSIGFLCAFKFKAAKDQLKGIDYLVMASAFGPILARVLRVIVILENLDTVAETFEPVFVLLPEVLQLFQLLLQLPFLFYADSVDNATAEDRKKPRRQIFKAIVLCLALCNITLWLIDSILLKVDVLQTIFKESRWEVFDGIFRPFSIFFRFNSFLILLRAFLR